MVSRSIHADHKDLFLEVDHMVKDPDCVWRREVNRRLATDYAELFARIDLLVMLKVPDFDAVRRTRALQDGRLVSREMARTLMRS